jgi:hypothetical protein
MNIYFFLKEEYTVPHIMYILDFLERDNHIHIDSLVKCQPCQCFNDYDTLKSM